MADYDWFDRETSPEEFKRIKQRDRLKAVGFKRQVFDKWSNVETHICPICFAIVLLDYAEDHLAIHGKYITVPALTLSDKG